MNHFLNITKQVDRNILEITRAKSTKSLRSNVLSILRFEQFANLKGKMECKRKAKSNPL